jgi:plastocyanin
MKKVMLGFLLVGALLAATCAQQGTLPSIPNAPTGSIASQGGGSSGSTAEILFGNDGVGSHFPPPSGHDASGNGRDNLIPRNVVIDLGGTVTFKMGFSGVHQVAIYKPGVEPDDIRIVPPFLASGGRGCPPVPLIDDPQNREAVVGTQMCAGGSSTLTYTFKTAGKFLVICTFLPHFNTAMYGWVTVRDR